MKKKTSIPYQTVNKFDQDCKTEEITKCIETGKSQEWLKLMWINVKNLKNWEYILYEAQTVNRNFASFESFQGLSKGIWPRNVTLSFLIFVFTSRYAGHLILLSLYRKISIHSFVDIRCPMNTVKGNINWISKSCNGGVVQLTWKITSVCQNIRETKAIGCNE